MRPRPPRTIGGLALFVAVSLGIATCLLGLLTYAVVHEEIERQIDHRIENEMRALLHYHRERGIAALAAAVRERDRRPAPGDTGYLEGIEDSGRTMGHIVIDGTGRRLADSLGAAIPPAGWSEFVRFRRPDGRWATAQAMNSPLPGGGRLIVAADRSIVDQMDLAIVKMFAIGFALIVLLGSLATIGFGRLVRQRFLAIEAAADAIMAGDIGRRIAVDGSGGEFDRLGIVLNRMLDRIAALVANLRQVSSDIAHDLRTPLNHLRGHLDQAERLCGPETEPHLAAAGRAAEDLLDLFSGLLAISEIEGHDVRSRFAPVALDEALGEIVEAYEPAFANAAIAIDATLAPVAIHGDRRLLQQSLANLLDNILAHTPAGTQARITLARDGNDAILTVADSGPGVPAADRQRIFERLTRLQPERPGTGHGLGLNMVAAIARAHFGEVRVVDAPVGLAIALRLPA